MRLQANRSNQAARRYLAADQCRGRPAILEQKHSTWAKMVLVSANPRKNYFIKTAVHAQCTTGTETTQKGGLKKKKNILQHS